MYHAHNEWKKTNNGWNRTAKLKKKLAWHLTDDKERLYEWKTRERGLTSIEDSEVVWIREVKDYIEKSKEDKLLQPVTALTT